MKSWAQLNILRPNNHTIIEQIKIDTNEPMKSSSVNDWYRDWLKRKLMLIENDYYLR